MEEHLKKTGTKKAHGEETHVRDDRDRERDITAHCLRHKTHTFDFGRLKEKQHDIAYTKLGSSS